MRNFKIIAFGIVGLLTACTDHPYNPNGPALDPNAPRVTITTPARGTIAGDVQAVTVTGTATDDVGVTSLTINGVAAPVAGDGSFTATVPVTPGTNLLHAIASDASGNQGTATRAVVAGPMTAIANPVTNGLTAALSAETFAAIGRVAANYMTSGDLTTTLEAGNPVINDGAPNGPDCLYVQGSITSFTIGGATVGMVPQTGGLALDGELDNVFIAMHLNYAAACINGSRDITISASHVSVTGNLAIGIDTSNGGFAIALDNSNVSFTGLDIELGGLIGDIADMLDLNTSLGPIVAWAAEKFVVPSLNTALAGLNKTEQVTVFGRTIDITVKPATINFSSAGAIVGLDTTLRAEGDDKAPGFVSIASTPPMMDTSHGFQLAVAQNAANQLFGSLWASGGLDQNIDLTNGSYGNLGTLYNAVDVTTAVPPYVDATGDGLVLTIGDLLGSFQNNGDVVTSVAINAQVDLKVTADATGAMKLDVGTPTVYVDVDDTGVDGANELSNEQFQAILSFALSRVIAVGSGSVGAIPLPTVGGVSVTNLTIGEQTGYVLVQGAVQ